MRKILVTGSCGQVGSELAMKLRHKYGANNVVATGHKTKPSETLLNSGPFEFIDVTDRETVEAVLMYCHEGLLTEGRQYIPRLLMHAIDLTFVDELLDRRNAVRGRAYFNQEIIPRELEVTPKISKYLDTLELISQHGLFSRILLPEIRDYPGRTHRRVARKSHLQQIEGFIDFLKMSAEERTKINKRAWLHIGETIRIGIILVGTTHKLQFEGTKPYVKRTAMDNAAGARTVYLIGYNLGVKYVPAIARESKLREIADEYELHPYDALISGELKGGVLARLSIPDGAGKEFLQSFPDTEEWPDLGEEFDTGIVSAKDARATETPIIENAASVAGAPEVLTAETLGTEAPTEDWELKIDAAWSKRVHEPGQFIPGSVAAADASRMLGVSKLGESSYKTLKGLLNASQYLDVRWSYVKNTVIRRCEDWELKIDATWAKRVHEPGQFIPGSVAAADAAKVLGVSKLGESSYKTLKGLLNASQYLHARWSCVKNTVIRR